MNKVHFRGKIRVICKGAERVDCKVNEYARDKTSATIKKRDKQKTDCNCKDDLANVVYKVHTASVEQVNDMSYAEGYA